MTLLLQAIAEQIERRIVDRRQTSLRATMDLARQALYLKRYTGQTLTEWRNGIEQEVKIVGAPLCIVLDKSAEQPDIRRNT